MGEEEYFLELDSDAVLKLPYCGPLTKRLYLIIKRKSGEKEEVEEIFVQRRDAFTIDLVYSIERLVNREISEIRYLCGLDGFVRIQLDDKGRLMGEYLCKSRSSLDIFREKLGLQK